MIEFILWLAILYFVIMFGASRLVMPHLRYEPVPDEIPAEMMKQISALKKKYKTKEAFLKGAYEFVVDRYESKFMGAFLYFHRNFWRDTHKIWHHKGVLACTVLSFLLRVMLVKSGMFKEDEIVNTHSICGPSIHQFLHVKVGKKWIYADPWGACHDVKFGEYGGWRVMAKVKEVGRKVFKPN